MPPSIGVGVIGCGNISGAYLQTLRGRSDVRVVACSDLDPARARAKADEFGVSNCCSPSEMVRREDVEIVLNLTVPNAHAEVTLASLAAGKHVYLEKPLAVSRAQGHKVLDAAKAGGLRVGCAPDTFLGSGVQTARKLIDSGAIGRPVAFTATMAGRGHEHWHPAPEFYYQPGGGPMLDMGPYYLTALLNLLGPVKRIAGFATTTVPRRQIVQVDAAGKPGPRHGQWFDVSTTDHVVGLMEFEGGATGTVVQSFAMRSAEYHGNYPVQIYGTEGAIKLPDPNGFDGAVKLCSFSTAPDTYRDMPATTPTGLSRGIGLIDMVLAQREGRPHRCSAEQAFAVLDLMEGFTDVSNSGCAYLPVTRYMKPDAMPLTPL